MKTYLKMIKNEVRHDENAQMKDDTELTRGTSSMKHGWCQTINNTVHCCQMPFDIAVILEQLSQYNNLLREKKNRNVFASNFHVTANEHMPKEVKDKNKEKNCKVEKDER